MVSFIPEEKRSRYTPRYHFFAPEQTCCRPFDPNGAIFWKGRHHVFYIYQDLSLPHGGYCWGHASSGDLRDWTIHPPALVPEPGDPDIGIFSGCAVVDRNQVPTLVYFGINAGCCIATAEDDDLIRWRKSPSNPVVPETAGTPWENIYHVFDPHVWVEGDHYLMIFGSRLKPFRQRDTVYLMRSDDLIHWEYVRPFYIPNTHWTEEFEDMACPDFFPLGNRHVLLGISHARGARYYLGRYFQGNFVPEEHHRLNHPGGSLFAPESYLDNRGRRIAWFWMLGQECNHSPECGDQMMALPRVMTLNPEGVVEWSVPEEYRQLRGPAQSPGPLKLLRDAVRPFREAPGDSFELELNAATLSGTLELHLLESPDGCEYATVRIDPGAGTIAIDSSRIGSRARVSNRYPICYCGFAPEDVPLREVTEQKTAFALHEGEPLRLRVFVDRSIIEVFANGRLAMSQLVYPAGTDNRQLSLIASAEQEVESLTAWPMAALTYRS